jgi:hypothetical protein
MDRSQRIGVDGRQCGVFGGMTHQARSLVRPLRLAVTLLPAVAAVIGPSQLLAQLQPLGAEAFVTSGEGYRACPTVAGRDDGSAVVLRVSGYEGQVRSVAAAPDGSFGADQLVGEGASLRGSAISGVAATALGYRAAWRLPDVWPSPVPPSLPGGYAGVGLDTAGAATSEPQALDHSLALLSPRPTGGYAATTESAGRHGHGIDFQLLSPQGEAIRAPVAVVRTGRQVKAFPMVTLHRPDGETTVLWIEERQVGLVSWEVKRETWMRRMSAKGRPLGQAVRLLPAVASGFQRQVWAAIGADGTLALAWVEPSHPRPRLRTFTATGAPLGPSVVITDGIAWVHALAFGAGGDVLVLWQAGWFPSSDSPTPIKASLFSRRGEPRAGPAELASDASAGYPWMHCADVASVGSGTNEETWLVSWLASKLPLDDMQILARRFLFDSARSRE